MSQFDKREPGFEAGLSHNEEMLFRVLARRNRLAGEWAARQMGLSDEEGEAYSKELVRAEFEEATGAAIVIKLLGDLTAAGVDIDESQIRDALGQKLVEARRQIIEQTNQ
jgi:hypothetical protein